MSTYNISKYDIELITMQNPIKYVARFEVYDANEQLIDEVDGIIEAGDYSISADSDIRRTVSLTIAPSQIHPHNMIFSEDGNIWLDKTVHLKIGIIDVRTEKIVYYPSGYYEYADVSGHYDVAANSLTVSLNDFMVLLDGTKSGTIGALSTVIPAYREDPLSGKVIEYNYIRDAMKTAVMQLGKVKDCYIDDIGEAYATERFNANYEEYRKLHPLWASIPYDLEFGTGTSVLEIVRSLRDLYPNYESFFDPIEYNSFICKQIPSCLNDEPTFYNDFMQYVVISEDTSVDLSSVRNVCEVWGQIIETDFYTEHATMFDGGVLYCTVDAFEEEYKNKDTIAIKMPCDNGEKMYLCVNDLEVLPIYDKNTDSFFAPGTFREDEVCVFQVDISRVEGVVTKKVYYIGAWQVHAIDALVDGRYRHGNHTCSDGTVVKKYSKEYFQDVYNCKTVHLTVYPDSPFTVQKLGELLDVKSGDEYENITTDSLAEQRAIYENWKNCRLTDRISITTLLVPFYDVNVKVRYRPAREEEERDYIISQISHNFDSLTSNLQMYRFYPLYNEEEMITIAYKGFDDHLVCLGYQYAVGETFVHDGEAEMCEEGFHFCLDINDCFKYYPPENGCRYAEVRAYGHIDVSMDDTKCVCKKIEIVREIPLDEARYIARKTAGLRY